MSLAHLMGMLNGIKVEKVDPPKTKGWKAEYKPVSGIKQPEKDMKLNFIPEVKDLGDRKNEVEMAHETESPEIVSETSNTDLSWMED